MEDICALIVARIFDQTMADPTEQISGVKLLTSYATQLAIALR